MEGRDKFTAGKELASGYGLQMEFAGIRMFGPGPICDTHRPGRANIYLLRRKVGS